MSQLNTLDDTNTLDIEAALNACLLELCSCQLDASHDAGFIVTLVDFPQCRGEGATIGDALQQARYEFGALRDCRAAWQLDAVIYPSLGHHRTHVPDADPPSA
jgi:hypothetical protein